MQIKHIDNDILATQNSGEEMKFEKYGDDSLYTMMMSEWLAKVVSSDGLTDEDNIEW